MGDQRSELTNEVIEADREIVSNSAALDILEQAPAIVQRARQLRSLQLLESRASQALRLTIAIFVPEEIPVAQL